MARLSTAPDSHCAHLLAAFVHQMVLTIMKTRKPTKVTAKEVAAFLEDRARQLSFDDVPIFYADLAAHFGLPPVTEAWHTHPLCGIFDDLDVEDSKRGSPFRTVLVVSQQHSIPGPGFFKTVARLCPQKQQPKTEIAKIRFFNNEVRSLLNHYGNTV